MSRVRSDAVVAALVPASGRDRLWRILRLLVWAILIWVVVRGVLDITAPPAQPPAIQPAIVQASTSEVDAFATAFARQYLTLTPSRPDEYELRLEPYLAPGLEPAAGVRVPPRSAPQSAGVAIVARRAPIDHKRTLVTVAVDVTHAKRSGVRYLTVPVFEDESGALAVYDYPALAAGPPRAERVPDVPVEPVPAAEQAAIDTLLERFFTAYLKGDSAELAFVTPVDIRIQPSVHPMRLAAIDSVSQLAAPADDALVCLVRLRAVDPVSGVSQLGSYRLELVKRDRWYVASINKQATGREPS